MHETNLKNKWTNSIEWMFKEMNEKQEEIIVKRVCVFIFEPHS